MVSTETRRGRCDGGSRRPRDKATAGVVEKLGDSLMTTTGACMVGECEK